MAGAKSHQNISFGCSVMSVVLATVSLIAAVIVVIVIAIVQSSLLSGETRLTKA